MSDSLATAGDTRDAAVDGLIDVNHGMRFSPFWRGTEEAGARRYDHINGVMVAVDFGHSGSTKLDSVHERAALYDASIQRQIEIAGPDALAFMNHLFTRDLRTLQPMQSRYGYVCWPDGAIITDAVVTLLDDGTVWFSPTNAESMLWAQGVAAGLDFDVTIAEIPQASMHLHGPSSFDILLPLVGEALRDLRGYRAMRARIAGAEVIVAKTVASPSGGYEVFAHDTTALAVWTAVVDSGREYGLTVKGFDNPSEAYEGGMVMITYASNAVDRMTPLEFWRPFVDLDGPDFIGRAALLRTAESGGPARRMVGLVGPDLPSPLQHELWPVLDAAGVEVGFTRWFVRSPRFGGTIAYALIDAAALDQASSASPRFGVVHPGGVHDMALTELPFSTSAERTMHA